MAWPSFPYSRFGLPRDILTETPRHKWTGVLIGSLSIRFRFEINASQFTGRLRRPIHRPSLMLRWHLSAYQRGQPDG